MLGVGLRRIPVALRRVAARTPLERARPNPVAARAAGLGQPQRLAEERDRVPDPRRLQPARRRAGTAPPRGRCRRRAHPRPAPARARTARRRSRSHRGTCAPTPRSAGGEARGRVPTSPAHGRARARRRSPATCSRRRAARRARAPSAPRCRSAVTSGRLTAGRGTTAAVPSTSSLSSDRRRCAIPRPIEPNEWTCTLARGMAHRVTLIPGDGTGPELTEATRRVLEATGVAFEWDVREAGVDVMETAGTPLPDETLASIKANKVALKGPITTPIGTGFRSVNVALRHELGLYACLRPCKSYPGVRSRYDDVDLVDRAREHRGPLRRHRVRGRDRGGRAGDRRAERAAEEADRRRLRHLGQADQPRRAPSGSSGSRSSTRAPTGASASRA